MEVRFDLHIHSEHSPDGRMSLDEIVSCARARGLQGVAVCDHDRALTETWDAPDFLLIPGVELSTDQGHLLGLFVTEQIEARELGAAIDAVHACGGAEIMTSAHIRAVYGMDASTGSMASRSGTVGPIARTCRPTPWRARLRSVRKSRSRPEAMRTCRRRLATAS